MKKSLSIGCCLLLELLLLVGCGGGGGAISIGVPSPTPPALITEYSIPTTPYQITKGPDGNLWFTSTDFTIGKITPTGKVSLYPRNGLGAGLQPVLVATFGSPNIVGVFSGAALLVSTGSEE